MELTSSLLDFVLPADLFGLYMICIMNLCRIWFRYVGWFWLSIGRLSEGCPIVMRSGSRVRAIRS